MSNHPRKKEKKKKKNTTEIASSSTHFACATKSIASRFLSRRKRFVTKDSFWVAPPPSLAVRHPSLLLMKVIKQCQADRPTAAFIAPSRGNSFSFPSLLRRGKPFSGQKLFRIVQGKGRHVHAAPCHLSSRILYTAHVGRDSSRVNLTAQKDNGCKTFQ